MQVRWQDASHQKGKFLKFKFSRSVAVCVPVLAPDTWQHNLTVDRGNHIIIE